jgi:hypothetical protein
MMPSQEDIHDAITCRHPPIPTPSRVESLHAKQQMKATIIARLSILILGKT